MKRSLVTKGLLAILMICILVFTVVSCGEGEGDPTGNPNDGVTVDKAALNAELALEVAAQGDYTDDSYHAYIEALTQAKKVANDTAATQVSVNSAVANLTAARLALEIRPVELVGGANRDIHLTSGENKELTVADYLNVNGLSKMSYKVLVSNEVVTASAVSNGKFTITAGEVNKETIVKVSINAYYDNQAKRTVELTVHITPEPAATLIQDKVEKEYDISLLDNQESMVLDFAQNVVNAHNLELTYSVKWGEETLTLDGSTYTLVFGDYTEEGTCETFTVTISWTRNGEARSVEYTLELTLKESSEYTLPNGSFETGNLDGWTMDITEAGTHNTLGWVLSEEIIAEWYAQNGDVMDGNFLFTFVLPDNTNCENTKGTLTSSTFILKQNAFISFKFGGAGDPQNHDVYIELCKADGSLIATFYNDLEGKVHTKMNAYYYQYSGEETECFIRVVDNSVGNYGCFVVDDFRVNLESAPEGYVEAIFEEPVDKAALNAELALEVTAQGDYTLNTYNAYVAALAEAKRVAADEEASQESVDEATANLTNARLALAIRPVEVVSGASKDIHLMSGESKELALSDYVNANGLSKITYSILASDELVAVGTLADGKFTITAGEVNEETTVTVTISVSYDGEEKCEVVLTVYLSQEPMASLKQNAVVSEYDLIHLENKENIVLDFAQNVSNSHNLPLTYTAKLGDEPIVLTGSQYTFTFGDYSEVPTNETFTVTITWNTNGNERTLEYTYTLTLTDTRAYHLENGGFENDLDGWTVVGNIGNVSSDTNYWTGDPENADGYAFGMDGDYMFSAYAPGAQESAVGTLTSSNFIVGGSGFVTFKVGAMRDGNYVYVDVVDAETKQILARYYNGLWADRTEDVKSGCTLIAYKADLSAFKGREVFFRISDNADSGYGLFFADSFVTYYTSEPEGFNTATPVPYDVSGTIYDVFNGGFEMGDVQGWWNDGAPGAVTNADAFFSGVAYGKDGTYLYSGVEDYQAGNGREANIGVLTSSVFEIGGTGYISFMLGGGDNQLCFVQVIDAVTGEILARYHQQAMEDAVLKQYVADLSAYIGRTARIQVVDQAYNNWGCVSFDNVVTYYPAGAALPEGAITANDIMGDQKYTIENGSFETGNLNGWTMNITEEGAHNTLGWVANEEIDAEWYTKNDGTKDGDFLFTFVTPDNVNCESTKGTLTSSTFSLKQGSFVAFKFGGAGSGQNHDVYIELCRADGSVIARFYNDAEGKANTQMNAYYYQYNGVEINCFFRVVDNSTGDYGCFVVDAFEVNLESAPEDYIAAIQ